MEESANYVSTAIEDVEIAREDIKKAKENVERATEDVKLAKENVEIAIEELRKFTTKNPQDFSSPGYLALTSQFESSKSREAVFINREISCRVQLKDCKEELKRYSRIKN